MRTIKIAFILTLLIILSGCATIISGGGKQKITITSTPSNAEIVILDGNGKRVKIPDLRTPATFNLSRSQGFFKGADYRIECGCG